MSGAIPPEDEERASINVRVSEGIGRENEGALGRRDMAFLVGLVVGFETGVGRRGLRVGGSMRFIGVGG